MKINVCILAGGDSCESAVSRLSCQEINKYLDREKYVITVIEILQFSDTAWVAQLLAAKPHIVLSALHGGKGENGSIQGLLECLNIPYVGSKVLSSALCMDKYMSKQLMRQNNIPVVADVFIPKNQPLVLFEEAILHLQFPLIVKPNAGGSSVGISIVGNYEELVIAVELVREMNDDILIEKYIVGKEVTCGIVETATGLELLTVLDIDTHRKFYDYNAKYEDDHTVIEFSKLPQYQQVMIQEMAKKVFLLLGCHGYGRVDLMVAEEQVYVLEMNTLPGLTSHSLIPKSLSSEKGFSQFLDQLIAFELATPS